MRKMLLIALREYNAAVRTKTFLISLVLMPLMMGGSLLVQVLLRGVKDTSEKKVAVVDRTGGTLAAVLAARMPELNTRDSSHYAVDVVEPGGDAEEDRQRQRFELSEKVRKGELLAVVEIGRHVLDAQPDPSADPKAPPGEDVSVRFQSDRITTTGLEAFIHQAIGRAVRDARGRRAGIPADTLDRLTAPVPVTSVGLTRRDPKTGRFEDVSQESRIASFAVPFSLAMLMFVVMMMGATPLMQGVVEEKMQRISEVLLGSVRPFPLMMGKLLGMTGVSITVTAVYLAGGLWAAYHFGFADMVSPRLLVWFFLFQALAGLMYGSLFIAVGAACSDMKETQNLLLPVMLVAMIPVFLMGNVVQEPNGPVATAASFFPFATPVLMMARLGIPPGVPLWQPLLGVVLVVLTTIACVWVAGRIFRVGILMQGKGARLAEMARWVLRG